jgi:hypothetical protein
MSPVHCIALYNHIKRQKGPEWLAQRVVQIGQKKRYKTYKWRLFVPDLGRRGESPWGDADMATARAKPGDGAFQQRYGEGQAMEFDAAVMYATG